MQLRTMLCRTMGMATERKSATAAGYYGIPVVVAGHHFGNASGMAPRSHENRTEGYTMCTVVSAIHASNESTIANDMYVGECQDACNFNQDIVRGNLLICSHSIRFVLGLSTVKQALETDKNLSAAGVVFYMDPFVIGFQLNPIPMRLPDIVFPSPDDSKVFLKYYNSSLERDRVTQKIVKFGAVACISGGIKANFSHSAPKIIYYSARGPDPEDNSLIMLTY